MVFGHKITSIFREKSVLSPLFRNKKNIKFSIADLERLRFGKFHRCVEVHKLILSGLFKLLRNYTHGKTLSIMFKS